MRLYSCRGRGRRVLLLQALPEAAQIGWLRRGPGGWLHWELLWGNMCRCIAPVRARLQPLEKHGSTGRQASRLLRLLLLWLALLLRCSWRLRLEQC